MNLLAENFYSSGVSTPLLVIDSLHDRSARALVQRIQRRHVLRRDFKAVNIRILRDTLRIVALGQRHPALLQAVPDQDLARRLAVLLRHGAQRRVVRLLVAHERAVRLDDDPVLLAVLDDLALLAPGMQL